MISIADLMNSDDSEFGAGAFFCAEGIVAKTDDPEKRCRVQCLLPIFDEAAVYDVWARRCQLFVGAAGFGDYHVPALGAEVVVIGRMGDVNNLFYAPLYDEERRAPSEFETEDCGIRVPGNYKIIAEKVAQILAKDIELRAHQKAATFARTIELVADQNGKFSAEQLELIAKGTAKFKGGTVTINADGSFSIKGASGTVEASNLSIKGGNVSISGVSVSIEGRPVKKVGPAI